jgi:hypothetical protein
LWCQSQELHDRKAQKGFAVAWIYGSGERGQKDTLGDHIREKNRVYVTEPGDVVADAFGELVLSAKVVDRWLPEDQVPKDTIDWFIKKQREAMEQTAPGIKKAMEWIKSLPMPLRWVSPSGVEVLNVEHKREWRTLKLWFGTKSRRIRAAVGYEPKMDESETKRPTSCGKFYCVSCETCTPSATGWLNSAPAVHQLATFASRR